MRSPDPDTIGRRQLEQRTFTERTLVVLGLSVAFIAVALFLWNAYEIFLLAFVGILVATFLNAPAAFLARTVKAPYGLALAVTIVGLLGIGAAGVWWLGPPIVEQGIELVEQLPESIDRLIDLVESAPGGRWFLDQLAVGLEIDTDEVDVVAGVTDTAAVLGNLTARVIYVLFLGIFLAAAPSRYRDGIVRLLPKAGQRRGREVLDALGLTLRGWLLGQIVSMFLVGTVVTTGLWIIGMPLALVLGIIAGLFEFIPILGPIVAFVPAALIALSQGMDMLLWVVVLYLILQQLEGNLIMPLVQKRAVHLPPPLTITAVFAAGAAIGLLGMFVATPLLAVTLVLVKMLYLSDVLHQHVELPGGVEEN